MFRAAASAGARAARRAFSSRAGGAAFSTAARAQAATAAFLFSNAGATAAAAAVYVAASTAACPVAYAAEKMERSFIMVKPDGVHRSLVGDIIKRFEGKGYKLVGIKVIVPSKDLASKHYAEHEGKPFFPKLVDFLSSGAVVAMVWEGKGVIQMGRIMIGATNPLQSNPGTIRGDYGIETGRNIIHGSDSVDSAQKEIALWFNADELADYDKVTNTWIYE